MLAIFFGVTTTLALVALVHTKRKLKILAIEHKNVKHSNKYLRKTGSQMAEARNQALDRLEEARAGTQNIINVKNKLIKDLKTQHGHEVRKLERALMQSKSSNLNKLKKRKEANKANKAAKK